MEVKSLIRQHVLQELVMRPDLRLDYDTPLLEGGHVTSLQAVELVMFLEERFQVRIEPEELTEEHFHSVNTISNLVQLKLG